MVKVNIILAGTLARDAGSKKVEVEAQTILQALSALAEKLGETFHDRLFDVNDKPRRFINIYVNGRDFRFLNRLETVLNSGDTISLLPAISGG
jgi:molybdopterin converting factor small subunit